MRQILEEDEFVIGVSLGEQLGEEYFDGEEH